MTDHDRDVLILGTTAFCEASNQGDDGIVGVLWSIVNRTDEHSWDAGKTLAATCLMAYAYSSWNTKDPNRVRALATKMTDPVLAKCLHLAELVISKAIPDPTGGATHYYSVKIAEPDWVSGINAATGNRAAPPATFTVQIMDHRFYRGVA